MAGRIKYSRADTPEANYVDVLQFVSYPGVPKDTIRTTRSTVQKIVEIATHTKKLSDTMALRVSDSFIFTAVAVEESGDMWALYLDNIDALPNVWYTRCKFDDGRLKVVDFDKPDADHYYIFPKSTPFSGFCIAWSTKDAMISSLKSYNSLAGEGRHVLGLVTIDDWRV